MVRVPAAILTAGLRHLSSTSSQSRRALYRRKCESSPRVVTGRYKQRSHNKDDDSGLYLSTTTDHCASYHQRLNDVAGCQAGSGTAIWTDHYLREPPMRPACSWAMTQSLQCIIRELCYSPLGDMHCEYRRHVRICSRSHDGMGAIATSPDPGRKQLPKARSSSRMSLQTRKPQDGALI